MKSASEELPGRPLVAVSEREPFRSWTIARLRSVHRGEREKRGKSARREIQVFATLRIVHAEYGDGVQVYSSAELFGRRQQAVREKAPHGPRYEFILREPDSMPLIIGAHPAFYGVMFRVHGLSGITLILASLARSGALRRPSGPLEHSGGRLSLDLALSTSRTRPTI